jgi:thiamine-monophosphate kinase
MFTVGFTGRTAISCELCDSAPIRSSRPALLTTMSSPASTSEWNWIDEIRRRAGASPNVPIGIGDDAALLRTNGEVLVATDMLMDGVDFIVGQTPPDLIGRKCLAVNLSDLAAMAGRPTGAVVSLALPKSAGRQLADKLYDGLLELAAEFDCPVVGGDTNSWDGPVTRGGAEAGDWLFVTGSLGGSLPSLRHCTFRPRLVEAQTLHQIATLHAMLDLSDGLASDLYHIAEASGVGIELDADQIPIHRDVDDKLPSDVRLQHALNDGEDFELAFSVSEADGRTLQASPPPGVTLFHIGRCVARTGVWLNRGGVSQPLPRGGWAHQFD